jgi:drug/metabolite transporter (DMT)-like permease
MKQTPNPSVTSRARTDDTHWMTLVAYVVVGITVTIYTGYTLLPVSTSPYSLLTGIVLTGAALLSLFAYFALFKDTIHLSHTESEWKPSWVRYFLLGFGIPLFCYLLLIEGISLGKPTPLIIVYSLVFSTTVTCIVYLYFRRRYVRRQ